jgi:hypothetical protein
MKKYDEKTQILKFAKTIDYYANINMINLNSSLLKEEQTY